MTQVSLVFNFWTSQDEADARQTSDTDRKTEPAMMRASTMGKFPTNFLSSRQILHTYLCTVEAARRLDRVKVEDNMVTEEYLGVDSS
jgi:hypothetical protein